MKTKHKHVLKMNCGITVEAEIDDSTGQFNCVWDPSPPYSEELIEKIKAEYRPWRDRIFEEFSNRTGLTVMIIET